MGPFCLPWLTFGALIVVAVSIVVSVVWALASSRSQGGGHE